MKQLFFLLLSCLIWLSSPCLGQENTEIADLYKVKCGICHTVGGGKLVGPDLLNVTDRHESEWLLEFIRSSQKMIKSGDEMAMKLFKENNEVEMPDPLISDDEILALLDYITVSSGGEITTVAYESILADADPEDLESGRLLFDGRKRFTNGGPSCLSCHNDMSNYNFSYNSYSTKDVSLSFGNLGEAGVSAILKNPPFPVMKSAFDGHDLTEDEVRDLLVYLQVGKDSKAALPGTGYFLYGILGAILLFVIYAFLWYNRKSEAVNETIYERQIRSTN